VPGLQLAAPASFPTLPFLVQDYTFRNTLTPYRTTSMNADSTENNVDMSRFLKDDVSSNNKTGKNGRSDCRKSESATIKELS
jgi:hypothetical protein